MLPRTKPRFGFCDKPGDGRQNAFIIRGARAAFAQQHGAIIAQSHDFRLGAAQINPEFHANKTGQASAAPQAQAGRNNAGMMEEGA
jgi:hypothetical protein